MKQNLLDTKHSMKIMRGCAARVVLVVIVAP
jgi:hypothetical protein